MSTAPHPGPLSRAWFLAGLVGVAGCASCGPRGNAVKVTLETTALRAETCFAVEALDATGTVRAESRFAREEDRTTYFVAVVRDTLPADVKFRARALIGPECATASRPNGVSETVDVTFDPKRVLDVTLHLTGGDGDGDGFVALDGGGGDCDDGDPTVSPGEHERCFGAVDHDCNGLAACADPACANLPCADAPARLRLVSGPGSLRAGACSGAVTVELQDTMGRATEPAPGARLVPTGAFSFFSDSACLAPVTDVLLLTTTPFAFTAAQPGVTTLTVSSRGLAGDTKDVEVLPSLPTSLRFANAPVMTTAGRCSPELTLELADSNGRATVADGPLMVSLSADAGGVFGFFSDVDCVQTLTSLGFDGGAARNTFHFSGQHAGPFTVRATSAPLAPIEQPALVTPGPVTTVQVSAASPALTAFTCSGAFTVDARDAYGNVVVPAALTVDVPDAGATVFTGVACSATGASDRFALIATEEGAFTVNVSADGVSATQPITVLRPGPAGSTWRWPLTVVTGARAPAGGYGGYTLLATFDSRGAVDAGQLALNAADLRVQFWSDAGWRDVDRLVENPNSANTTVRFASQTELPSSAADVRYSFFTGPFDGGAAPANPHSVYLFADDFEEGTLGRWTLRGGGNWVRATDRAHGGTGSVRYDAQSNTQQYLEANPALDEADVMFEAWWNTSNTGNTDFSQVVRLQPGAATGYETNLEDTNGWNLAWMNGGAYAQLVGNQGAPANNTWARVGVSLSGRDLRVWLNRVQLVPTSGAHQVALPALPSGNVGFRKWDLGGSIWIDDVTARRYTEPEPGVSVGAPVRTP